MNPKTSKELLERIECFNDNAAIISELHSVIAKLEYLECSGDSYWVSEAICNLTGMHELLMDFKKAEKIAENKASNET